MNLEQQVVNLHFAKILKELGVKQESLFYWCETNINNDLQHVLVQNEFSYIMGGIFNDEVLEEASPSNCCTHWESSKINRKYSAFTATELLAMLPDKIHDPDYDVVYKLVITKDADLYIVIYETYPTDVPTAWVNSHDTNLLSALAKVLILLIKTRAVTL